MSGFKSLAMKKKNLERGKWRESLEENERDKTRDRTCRDLMKQADVQTANTWMTSTYRLKKKQHWAVK